MAPKLVAITGASGFLGSHTIAALAEAGMNVRALTRSLPLLPPAETGFRPEVVPGDLSNHAALATLVDGADVVIHCAGAIKAKSLPDFLKVNEQGTRNLAHAMQLYAPQAHLVVVSSLAAREPHLSSYAASKRAGEIAAREVFAGRLTIVRPSVIYGPGDRETLAIFKLAGQTLVPSVGKGTGRIALIHVSDAAAVLAALCDLPVESDKPVLALSDPHPAGYARTEILSQAAAALGRKARFLPFPVFAFRTAALASELFAAATGRQVVFTRGKAREFLHPDWSVHPDEMPPPELPYPKININTGFASTVGWYRKAGWLAP